MALIEMDPRRDYWINMTNENGFIVIAPEFSSGNYSGLGDNYLMANIFDDRDKPTPETFNDKNEWTFSTLDPLFDYVKAAVSGTQEKYIVWGHSGGAQFLHRFVTYLPHIRLDVAVCSNAGWYTVPELPASTVSFPYGILNGQLPNEDLIKAFSRKLIVHLGQNDNNPNSGLRRNAVVDAQQGIHRLERGQYYFSTSQATAQNMTVPFNWEKREIAGVGYQAQLIANDALQYILPSFLSVDRFEEKDSFNVYPNPSSDLLYFNNRDVQSTKAEIYTISGKLIKTTHFSTYNSKQEINVSKLTSVIYFIKLNHTVVKFLKR